MSNPRSVQLERLATLPTRLAACIEGLSAAEMDTITAVDIWSIQQIVHHVADSHMNAYIRMRLILTETNPTLKPYDQDRWALLADSSRIEVASSLAILQGLHRRWVATLEGLDQEQWDRVGFHPENGTVRLAQLLDSYAQHGDDHIEQINRIKVALATQ